MEAVYSTRTYQNARPMRRVIGGTQTTIMPNQVLLGVCADERPMLMDFTESHTGALLVSADDGYAFPLLKSMTTSILTTMQPGTVEFTCLTRSPQQWQKVVDLAKRHNCLRHVSDIYEDDVTARILALAQLAEWRLHGRAQGALQWVVIDQLDDLFRLDNLALENLAWLLKVGGRVGIRVAASLPAELGLILEEWVCTFQTRIFGTIRNRQLGQQLIGAVSIDTSTLEAGRSYTVRSNGRWTTFRILPQDA